MQLIGAIFGILFWSLIGAMFLRAGFKIVMKEKLEFGSAFGTVFITNIINVVVVFLVSIALGSANVSENIITGLPILFIPAGFLIQSAVISSRHNISFRKACLVSAAIIAVFLGLALITAGIIFAVMKFN
jgi:hypothetical protein